VRLTLESGGDLAALVRGADAESVVAVVRRTSDGLAMAVARAAIGPLAVERTVRSPACRVNAVFVDDGAAADDVDAAVRFLESARSTTGQILDLA
jgi:hypothetical protein